MFNNFKGKCTEAYDYEVTASVIDTENGTAEVYGVHALMYENGRLFEEATVDDLFCSRREAEDFVALLRENEVEPCQVQFIAEDYLQR